MMKSAASTLFAIGIALGLAWSPAPAAAQSISANAIVLGGNLEVTRERDLDFGDVLRGVPATVVVTDATSGRFRIRGTRGAEVSLTFLLPTLLAVGPYTMPISFGPTAAGHYVLQQAQNAVLFDPNAVRITRLRASNGLLYVWLGGTVSPSLTQAPGVYSGNVTLVITYTGN
jgi:hypothetical protein